MATEAVTQEPAPLDPELLAEALWGWGFEVFVPVFRDDVKEPTEAQRRMARKLAFEYDRLAALRAAAARTAGSPAALPDTEVTE